MNPKTKNIQAQKLLCLTDLLIDTLSDLKVTTPKMIKYKADLIAFGEELFNEVADTEAILRSTYFQELTSKVDTVIRKQFQDV